MKQVKHVIWDLDETFWRGTLSEGPIDYRMENHDIVMELTQRGNKTPKSIWLFLANRIIDISS